MPLQGASWLPMPLLTFLEISSLQPTTLSFCHLVGPFLLMKSPRIVASRGINSVTIFTGRTACLRGGSMSPFLPDYILCLTVGTSHDVDNKNPSSFFVCSLVPFLSFRQFLFSSALLTPSNDDDHRNKETKQTRKTTTTMTMT